MSAPTECSRRNWTLSPLVSPLKCQRAPHLRRKNEWLGSGIEVSVVQTPVKVPSSDKPVSERVTLATPLPHPKGSASAEAGHLTRPPFTLPKWITSLACCQNHLPPVTDTPDEPMPGWPEKLALAVKAPPLSLLVQQLQTLLSFPANSVRGAVTLALNSSRPDKPVVTSPRVRAAPQPVSTAAIASPPTISFNP